MLRIDKSDKKILMILQNNGKISNTKLAEGIHLVTGRHDYLIKINLRDVDELKDFIFEKLTKIEFISKVETFLSISSITNTNFKLVNEND